MVDTDRLSGDDLRHRDPRFGGVAGAPNRQLVDRLRGSPSIGRLEENAGAVEVALSAAEVDKLERVAPRQARAGDRVPFVGSNWCS